MRTYQSKTTVVDKPAGMAPAFAQGGFRWGSKLGWHGLSDGSPKTGTWEVSDMLFNRLADSPNNDWSGWIGAICTLGGTAGAYTEHLTATADGSSLITLGGPTAKLSVGQYVIISGVTAQIAIIDATKTKLTLAANVPAGDSLAIAYRPPVWRRFGKLE